MTRDAAIEPVRRSFGWRWLAPLIFVFLWSGGFAVAKIGLRDATPMAFLAVRYALVILVLAVLLALIRPPVPGDWRSYGHLAVTGFCIQVLYFGLSYLGFWLGASAGGLASSWASIDCTLRRRSSSSPQAVRRYSSRSAGSSARAR